MPPDTKILPFPGVTLPAAPAPSRMVSAVALERVRWMRKLEANLEAGHRLSAAIRILKAAFPQLPAEGTIRRWHLAWKSGGAEALLDNRIGRQRKSYGWEARAIELWNNPARPAAATVAYWLQQEGFADATASRLRRYFKSMPSTLCGDNSPRRAGKHYYKQNHTPHAIRDESAVDVGLIYEGDGHRVDVFVQHPTSGHHCRPELTIWIDIRSHYIVGWHLSADESSLTTLFSLSKCFLAHDHVPSALHVDKGSGFQNKMLMDETTGWLDRLGISVITALPGNARGKGLVEGWFHWFIERCAKRFDTYCGHDRTDQKDFGRFKQHIKHGRMTMPTMPEFIDAVTDYVASYNHTPQTRIKSTPAALWADLEKSPVELPAAALMRPAETRKVQRGGVTLYGRIYRHPHLILLNEKEVIVEYDLQKPEAVWITWQKKRVCEATLVEKRPWVQANRLEDLQAKETDRTAAAPGRETHRSRSAGAQNCAGDHNRRHRPARTTPQTKH